MKKVLFATTALAGLAIGGVASAQGIALFGDARLGLGYNIDNDGDVALNDDGDTDDDLRAVSRVRFGVNMTGETDSGITFGATIRADNASRAARAAATARRRQRLRVRQLGHPDLRRHQRRRRAVGRRRPGQLLADRPRRPRRDRASSRTAAASATTAATSFAANPFARPTVRYDFDIMGFGLSLSSNRDLTDIGVGTGYAADFGGGSWSVGVGYYKFDSFDAIGERPRGRGLHRHRRTPAMHLDVVVPGAPAVEVLPGRRAVVGRPERRLRGLRLRRDLHQAELGHRRRRRVRRRQHPGRRLVRLGCLRGRCLSTATS